MIPTKICGIKDLDALQAAIKYGARYVGFVFYPKSARYIARAEAQILSRHVPTGVKAVGLFVNPADAELDKIATTVQLDMIQLHGDETPGRVSEIKAKYPMQVMKALRIASKEDLEQASAYESATDWLLFDAKTNHEYGGTGHAFDWELLKDKTFKKPWMLAGGLNAGNIGQALKALSPNAPNAIDISSGVESAKGIKDAEKIKEFLNTMKAEDF